MHIKDIDKYSKLSLNAFQWDEKLLFNDLLILPIIGLIIGKFIYDFSKAYYTYTFIIFEI